jgi:triacylglycerol lipase
MYFPAAPFSLPDAVLCAELVITGYDMYHQWVAQGKPSQPNFIWKPNGPAMTYGVPIWGRTWWWPYEYEPFAFVAYTKDSKVYFAARGSETYSDWADDFDVSQEVYSLVPGYGSVHRGFMGIYASMSLAVLAAVNNAFQQLGGNAQALYFTAHSLGAALSTLAVPDVLANSNLDTSKTRVLHYPLASPRVGDPDFYYQYSYQMVPTYRIIDTEDIVPDLPPSVVPIFDYIYKHVGMAVTYTAQYDSDAGNHDHKNSYYYALTNPYQPEGPIVSQPAEADASARLLRLKQENSLLKRLLAEREMELATTRGQGNS